MSTRDPLFDVLREAWERWDPPPGDLADAVLVALAVDDLEGEYELLTLVARHDQLVGARGDGDSDRVLLEFRSAKLSVLVRVGHEAARTHRLDGWVTPATGGTVTIVQGEHTAMALIEANGRFEFPEIEPGLTRLVIAPLAEHPLDQFRTTLFEI